MKAALSHFGERAQSVYSVYVSDNLAAYKNALDQGYSPKQAATKTLTGRYMQGLGFQVENAYDGEVRWRRKK